MTNMFKKKRIAASVLACALAFTSVPVNGVTAEAATNKKAVKKVTVKVGKKNVTKKTYKLKKGSQMTLKVSTTPASAKKSVSFSSSKKTVATVSNKGKVTAKNAGTAKITIKVKGKNNKTTTTWVKVNVPKEVVKLKEINVTPATTTIDENAQTQIKVTSGTPGASIASVLYESSNPQILTVNSKTGVVTGVNVGQADVNIIAKDKYGNTVKDAVTITVKPASEITLNIDTTAVTLAPGETKDLTARYDGASASDVLTWESRDTSVVKVTEKEGGQATLTAVAAGTTTVKAKIGNKEATCEVTVQDSAISITQVVATHYNTVKVSFNKPVTVDERKDMTFKMKVPNSTDITQFEVNWADDGRSVELNKRDGYTAGTYTLEIASDNVGISPTGNTKEFTIAKRTLKRIEFENKYLPLAVDPQGNPISAGKSVKVRFKAMDQYGDPIENQNAENYTFSFGADDYGLNDDVLNKGIDYISFVIPSSAKAGEKIDITVYPKGDYANKIGTATYELQKLDINRVVITGVEQEKDVFESDQEQEISLKCEVYDTQGQHVNLEDDNFNGITVTFKSGNEEICTEPGFTQNLDRIVIKVKPGKHTEIGEPVQLTAVNAVDGDKDKNSIFLLNVKQKSFPTQIVLDVDSKVGTSVISKDVETAKVPISFKDQYGEPMPAGSVDIATLTKYYNITTSAENAEGWDISALNIETKNDKDYLTISGEDLSLIDDTKENGLYNLNFSHTKAAYANNTATLKVQVGSERKASRFVITSEYKTSLYDNEITNFTYKILDQHEGEWTKDVDIDVIEDSSGSVIATVNEATKTVTVQANKPIIDSEDEVEISFGVKGCDKSTYTPCSFDVKENFAELSVTVKNPKDEYVAGDPIVLQVQAKDSNGNVLKSYNEEVIGDFNVMQYDNDVYPEGKTNTSPTSIKFVNGVAEIETRVLTATDAASFGFKLTFPGHGTEPEEYKTELKDAIKVVYGDVTGYKVEYNKTKKKITVTAQDIGKNTVESFKDSKTLVIKVNGEQVSKEAYQFANGVATITLSDAVAVGSVISVEAADGTMSGKCTVSE